MIDKKYLKKTRKIVHAGLTHDALKSVALSSLAACDAMLKENQRLNSAIKKLSKVMMVLEKIEKDEPGRFVEIRAVIKKVRACLPSEKSCVTCRHAKEDGSISAFCLKCVHERGVLKKFDHWQPKGDSNAAI